MVVAKRLAPVREREVRLGLLREFELRDRLLPPETVKDGDASQEVALRLGFRRRRERQRADVFQLRRQRRGETQQRDERDHSACASSTSCKHLRFHLRLGFQILPIARNGGDG